jgi:hypothetical protein
MSKRKLKAAEQHESMLKIISVADDVPEEEPQLSQDEEATVEEYDQEVDDQDEEESKEEVQDKTAKKKKQVSDMKKEMGSSDKPWRNIQRTMIFSSRGFFQFSY